MQIKRGGGGFTLAELLIVMAIIVVLAAVAIPTFGRQLETARETGDMEIIRSAYTEAMTYAVLDASDGILNGQNGEMVFPLATDTNATVGYTAATAASDQKYTTAKYTVVLEKMDPKAKIQQTGYNWQYVNRYIVGTASVPAVTRHTSAGTGGTTAVTFQFIMPTSDNKTDTNPNVRLAPDKDASIGTSTYAITVTPENTVYS